MRTCGRSGILRSVERTDVAGGDACDAVDGLREVVPRRDALVREMVDARHDALVDGRHDGGGEVAGIGRSTDLVEDDAEFLLLTTEAQHGLDKIVAEGRVEPSGAYNHGF